MKKAEILKLRRLASRLRKLSRQRLKDSKAADTKEIQIYQQGLADGYYEACEVVMTRVRSYLKKLEATK